MHLYALNLRLQWLILLFICPIYSHLMLFKSSYKNGIFNHAFTSCLGLSFSILAPFIILYPSSTCGIFRQTLH